MEIDRYNSEVEFTKEDMDMGSSPLCPQETLITRTEALEEMQKIKEAVYNSLGHEGDDSLWDELSKFLWKENVLEKPDWDEEFTLCA